MDTAASDLADRLVDSAVGFMDLLGVAIGDRLGFYRALAASPGLTSAELARHTRTHERYVREWAEHQAVTGLLTATEGATPKERRYRPAAGVAEVLTDADSLVYLAPLARQLAAAAVMLPAVADAYVSGGGVPWASYGRDMRESEGDLNRPAFLQLLADDWLAALPDVQRRLAQGNARVADVGCGAGWSSIAIARSYPCEVDAFEVDHESVVLARGHVSDAGMESRVSVWEKDIGEVVVTTPYALVTAFECLHDMPHPVAALRAMRRLAAPDGTVLIADMKVADRFGAPGDDVERMMYGFSILICLPDSMSAEDSAATGTVMRESTLRAYAEEAGFAVVDVLDVEHDMWRFYRLMS